MAIQPRGASSMVETNGVRLHCLEYGGGEADVVIIPGITSPAITWEFAAEELARDYHVYVTDVRGRGLSDKPPTGHSFAEYAADTRAVIDGLRLERPIVLGHSIGARTAAALAALHSEAVGATVIVDPPLTGPGREPYSISLQAFLDALHAAQAGTTAEDVQRAFPRWSLEQAQTRADWLPTCDETAIIESYRSMHEEDFFDYWPHVQPPVLFLYGEDSPAVPASSIGEVRGANPQVEIIGVPRAGHMIPWDNLAGFLAPVRQFISTARTGRPSS